ncbi:MAG: FAD-linked oxidase C-terminal domain-containing protein [Bacteroidota bacterium]
MTATITSEALDILKASLEGELYYDQLMRTLYATDASVYREMPVAVAMPKNKEDLIQLIHFAKSAHSSLIPRTAGTSLAGQCVGDGIVVDTSRHFNQILEINAEEGWVRVQPGVVRDELNHALKPFGLFFGPNTSTANRAMIGGMVGNNSCGSYSIVYGTTRDHVRELTCILSDGSEVVFGELSAEAFAQKCELDSLEGQLYRQIRDELSQSEAQEEIRTQFPHPKVQRRNTGYAVDELLKSEVFTAGGPTFNFCKLLAGSEGTLAFTTEIKIHVDPLPPPVLGLICVHFGTIRESLEATVVAMQHQPRAVELMDKIVMDCTKGHLLYDQYRFFIQGDPEAVLIMEAGGQNEAEVKAQLDVIQAAFEARGFGYAFPRIFGEQIRQVWDLRKAGLGLLANIPGDPKAVAVIEDTSVTIEDLPDYIDEFSQLMKGFGQDAVYYAHAGAGELHLRPILDLKKSADRQMFRKIGQASAELVKKYGGSLSGEHGDGRVRAEFVPIMVGEANYELFRRIKQTWDPHHLFNPGKIVDAAPMDTALRYEADQTTREFETLMDFSDTGGILRTAEKCNGSADCRKNHLAGGTMCPSYMATRNEKDTTRARANTLREMLTQSTEDNPFAHQEIYEVMDLCLSCKGCASECPSNVNVANLKAEFLHQYYQTHGVPFRARAIASVGRLNKLGSIWPGLTNLFLAGAPSGLTKKILGMAPQRTLPKLQSTTLRKWLRKRGKQLTPASPSRGKLCFFADEFTNFLDTDIGIKAIELLLKLGYEVEVPSHAESGRAHLSKGLLKEARRMAMYNVQVFSGKVNVQQPLVGLEPSAILSFRDEYPRLVIPEMREKAKELARHVLTLEEFLQREMQAGRISADDFHQEARQVLLHGHCHQKALSSVVPTQELLSLPANYEVEVIPSGCCGMAGSFGYEKEHYELSMQIGELVLFPAVREAKATTLIAAPGTSCRHQIWDGTQKKAYHPAEILWAAVKGE